MRDASPIQRAFIEFAEVYSYCICETCGDSGLLYKRYFGYLTRCPEHAPDGSIPVVPNQPVFGTRGKYQLPLELLDIDQVLSKGERPAIEALSLRILRDPMTALQMELLYEARTPKTNNEGEFYARNAYEAAYRLALLSRDFHLIFEST